MKHIIWFLIPIFLLLGLHNSEAQAVQRIRKAKANVVQKTPVTLRGQRIRTVRRVKRRRHRRIQRRTLAALPNTSKTVRFRNTRYYPYQGYYYIKTKGSIQGVIPPVGFRILYLPWNHTQLTVENRIYFYSNGVFLIKTKKAYEVVSPPIGAIVKTLPEDHETLKSEEVFYYLFDDTLYIPQGDKFEVIGFLDS